MKRSGQGERGFTLILVVMLIAVLAMMAMALIHLIKMDMSLVGQSRRDLEAREVAEGGAMEVLNDTRLPTMLPGLSSATLTNAYTVPANSPFANYDIPANIRRQYDGRVNLVRVAPMGESSLGLSRALVYEIDVTSIFNDGQSSAQIKSEVYKPVAFQPGTVLPRRHFK